MRLAVTVVRVALFYKCHMNFVVESRQHHGPNVSTFLMVVEGRRWYVVVCYLVPHNASTLECVVTAIGQIPQGMELLVANDFNVDLSSLYMYARNETIMAVILSERLEDMALHLSPHYLHWTRDRQTWRMICCGKDVKSWY